MNNKHMKQERRLSIDQEMRVRLVTILRRIEQLCKKRHAQISHVII